MRKLSPLFGLLLLFTVGEDLEVLHHHRFKATAKSFVKSRSAKFLADGMKQLVELVGKNISK